MSDLFDEDTSMANTSVLRNPYIAGRSLSQQGFYGREKTFQLVETELASPERNAIVLFGQRRIGKTSILRQLQRRLAALPFLPVYFDLMDRARRPLGQVLYEIAATIAAAAGVVPYDPEQFDDQGKFFRQEFLPKLYQALGDDRRPVLLLDEFDVLDVAAEEQLPPIAAARAFFPYLRELMQGEPRLGFVFVVGRRTEDLSINVKATFKSVRYKRVSVLDVASARELILTAQRQGSLEFGEKVVERILALTSGQPYFIQLLCQILWDSAHAYAIQSIHLIDAAAVEAAVPKVLEAGENIFEWIWDGLPPAERVIFAAIAQIAGEQAIVTEDQLLELLQSQGIRILTRELELAPATLVEWEMLRKVDGGYRFFVELMRQWVATRKPLPRVKDELDRVVPQADLLYRSGDGYYRQHELENAIGQLRAALRVNPNHLKARLLCGQVLLEQGNLVEATQDLEEAYRHDEDSARYPLINALLAYSEVLERNAQNDDALKVYMRVLELSPRSQLAQERRAAIWVARAEAAVKAEDFATAVAAYREAGQPERALEIEAQERWRELQQALANALQLEKEGKWDQAHKIYVGLTAEYPKEPELTLALARVEGEQRKQTINRAVATAKKLEQSEEWDKAVALYQRLVGEFPEDARWPNELVRVQEEQSINKIYLEGIGAVQARQWDQALRSLAYVIHKRSDYKDATNSLMEAIRARDADQQRVSQTAEQVDRPAVAPKDADQKSTPAPAMTNSTPVSAPTPTQTVRHAQEKAVSGARRALYTTKEAERTSAPTPTRTSSAPASTPTPGQTVRHNQEKPVPDKGFLFFSTSVIALAGTGILYLNTQRTAELTPANVLIWVFQIAFALVILSLLWLGVIVALDGNMGVWGVLYPIGLSALSTFGTGWVYTFTTSAWTLGNIFLWLLVLGLGGLTLIIFFWLVIPAFKKVFRS
jgi:tetratricopeptide (TPR) repeat protein